MRVLIVESEIYLAQSIENKLVGIGFDCEIFSLTEAVLDYKETEKVDVVLLSTSVSGQNFYPIVEKFKEKIIILIVPYVSEDTVSIPLKMGATDYVSRPLLIEELLRKITHYIDFRILKSQISFYRDYLQFALPTPNKKISEHSAFPIVLQTNSQKLADSCVISYVRQKNINLHFFSLYGLNINSVDDVLCLLPKVSMLYVVGLEILPLEIKKELLERLYKQKIIFSNLVHGKQTENTGHADKNVIELVGAKEVEFEIKDEILSVDEYVRMIISRFESKYPDTELSKKLGMSRKSLWEKRKRYGISKKK